MTTASGPDNKFRITVKHEDGDAFEWDSTGLTKAGDAVDPADIRTKGRADSLKKAKDEEEG